MNCPHHRRIFAAEPRTYRDVPLRLAEFGCCYRYEQTKIAEAEHQRVHAMLVIGARDLEAGNVAVRLHGKGKVGAKSKGEVVAEILAAIKERPA